MLIFFMESSSKFTGRSMGATMHTVNWKRIAFVTVMGTFAILILTTSIVFGQEVTLTSKVKGDYLGGDGATFYKGPVLQSDVYVNWKNGVFADVWTSTSNNTQIEFDKEVDLAVGRGGNVGPMKYLVDVEYYVIKGIDVLNANIEVGRGGSFARLEAYSPRASGGPRKGLITAVGHRAELPIGHSRVSAVGQGWLKGDSGCFGFDKALLAQGYVGLKVGLWHGASLVGGARLSTPISKVGDGRKKEAVWETGLSHSF